MFPSNGSAVGPFAQVSSSPFTASSYIHDQYSTNGILYYHHHNQLSIPSLPTTSNPSVTDTQLNMAVSSNYDMMSKLDLHVLNGDQHSPSNFHPRKGPVKKERHSKKIYTARGLRERRVRLSIQVARKFFDLQDMLGFDKASKTLEWLLKKSRKAIKELAENSSAKSPSSSSACEVVSQNDGPEGIASKTDQSLPGVSGEREMMKQAQKSVVSLVERESRTRARARARERTRKKMTSRALHESKNCSDWCHHCLTEAPRSLNHQQLAREKSGACCHGMTSSPKVVAHEVEGCTSNNSHHMSEANINIEGSVVMERKFMKLSTGLHYQQNPEMSKSVTFNIGISDNHNQNMSSLAQIWDINGAVGHSSISAVDNMNLSTELQLYGKLWEAAGKNPCPH